MGEFGDGLVEEVDDLGAAPGAAAPHVGDSRFEVFQGGPVVLGFVLDDSYACVCFKVEGFAGGVEFLEVFFAGCVAGKEIDGPFAAGF